MSNGYESDYEDEPEDDELVATLEADDYDREDDSEDEPEDLDEAVRRRRRFRKVRTAGGVRTAPPVMPRGVVTHDQLRIALERVNKQIAIESRAISKLDSRIETIGDRITHEATGRKKNDTKELKALRQMRDMSMLMPLLMQPPSKSLGEMIKFDPGTPPGTSAGYKAPSLALTEDKPLLQSTDTLTTMLPFLLFGLTGSDSGMSGDSSQMMMLVLALTLAKK